MDLEALARVLARRPATPEEDPATAAGRPQGEPATPTPGNPTGDPPAWLEAREERAAILEHEAGADPETADTLAARLHPEPEALAERPAEPQGEPGPTWRGFTRLELETAAGPDWPEIADRPEALDALAALMETGERRARGELPAHYTRAAYCETCGPVFLWPEAPRRVSACPWCLAPAGPSFPRPLVRCGTCRHFAPSETSPAAGLGSCRIEAPARRPNAPPCWPGLRRSCGAWRPRSDSTSEAGALADG